MDDRRATDPKIDAIITKLDEVREDQIKIKKILLGNGEVGLCEKVRTVEDRFVSEAKRTDELFSDRKKIVFSVIMLFIATIVGMVFR